MKKSVKQYILSTVFSKIQGIEVLDNRINNGFSVGIILINSYVFEKLSDIRDYLFLHHVSWYVTTDEFPGHSFDIPCIRFYDDEDDD